MGSEADRSWTAAPISRHRLLADGRRILLCVAFTNFSTRSVKNLNMAAASCFLSSTCNNKVSEKSCYGLVDDRTADFFLSLLAMNKQN